MSSPLTELHNAIEEKNVGKMLSILYENPLLLTIPGEYSAARPHEDPVTVIEHLCRLIKKEYDPTRPIDPAILQMIYLVNMIAPSEISNENPHCKGIAPLFRKHMKTVGKTAFPFKINPENLPKLKAAARALERERNARAHGRAEALEHMARYAAARPAENARARAAEIAAEIRGLRERVERLRDEALARERAGGPGAGARAAGGAGAGNGEVIPPAPVPTGPRPTVNLSHLSDDDIFEFLRDNLDEEEFFKITNHREYLQNRPNLFNGGARRTRRRQKKQRRNRKTKYRR
jgi:hypothetical protein